MVGEKRLELLHIAVLDPKSSASAIPPLALGMVNPGVVAKVKLHNSKDNIWNRLGWLQATKDLVGLPVRTVGVFSSVSLPPGGACWSARG